MSSISNDFVKKITIDTSSLTDIKDSHDPEIIIDQLLPMEDIDFNSKLDGPDEYIDDDPPSSKVIFHSDSSYAKSILSIIICILIILAIISGIVIYNNKQKSSADIEEADPHAHAENNEIYPVYYVVNDGNNVAHSTYNF